MEKNKTWKMPDTYIIIFFVVLAAALLTLIVPVGVFTGTQEAANGKTVLDPTSYTNLFIEQEGELVADASGETHRQPIALFKPFGGMGVLNYVFEGLTSGSKWGTAVGIIAFILIAGGSFGVVLRTGAVENGILAMIARTKGKESLLIPVLFLLFSLGGAIFGMGEEAIPLAMIVIPIVIAMGYDAVTGILITYAATQIGFATSWMNPFSVAVAQGVAGVPLLSGAVFRIIMWAVFTAGGIVFTWMYARKIRKNPESSVSYESDAYFRDDFKARDIEQNKFTLGHGLILLTVLAAVVWVVWGVVGYGVGNGYYIPSIATVFFIMGLVSIIIGGAFKLNGMDFNEGAAAFRQGAADLVGAALVVGMAKGIILVLGGDDTGTPNILNTILYGMGSVLSGLPQVLSAWFMYLFQSIFNFFVVSGSGQAALTMPLMAPLAEIVGVSKQVAVLAFQLGDGFTNLIVPTSGCLMGVLGVARLDWGNWVKFQIKFQGILAAGATVFIIIAVLTGF
ncbi:MAG: putative basic amino acid antiporter YfcC [Spirochaetales bacterium]|nr:putative basic amino acid antiporter YfcC [Spirochaetales bacterium]